MPKQPKDMTEFVAFRESKKIVDLIKQIAKSRGIDRSDFIREAIRKELARLNYLEDFDKKALGIK